MKPESIQSFSEVLVAARDEMAFDLYRCALEYDIIEPIVINDRSDLRSEPSWRDRVEPYHHQVSNLMSFCRRLPVTLLADDVGLGKTISAGLIASELISRGHVKQFLVVCPKLLMPQWREELDAKFGIGAVEVVGARVAHTQVPGAVGALVTTYHSARLHLDRLCERGFDMLILDEAHKLRNLYGTLNPPMVALQFRKVLAERHFKYVLMLTATPIQNRLWDLYSLIDLLTVARGHANPFGSEYQFERDFIADEGFQARKLRAERKLEFRSIVYSYMSRIRRGDAALFFPKRIVQLHLVEPSEEENRIFDVIAAYIEDLNRLAQISLLQALVSSPQAFWAQLEGMADRGTASSELANAVRPFISRTLVPAKLEGLGVLIDQLQKENPVSWRAIVFTGRRETQAMILEYLRNRGCSCGFINGESGPRNHETLAKFRKSPPDLRVIVSTEAGSEGINLQAANVLINFDLPWNPMIVEQRIGRIQRLASEHATVCVLNIILRDTFEEEIVGRLMEKLQLAAQAIGDIEALLEASDLGDNGDERSVSFDEKIRQLVVASLRGRDVRESTRLAEQSILAAKMELEREEANINSMLGSMKNDYVDRGPRSPEIPPQKLTMDPGHLVLSALRLQGARVSQISNETYLCDYQGKSEYIGLSEQPGTEFRSYKLYTRESPHFAQLVGRLTARKLHQVKDVDKSPAAVVEALAKDWVKGFGGEMRDYLVHAIRLCFQGTAVVKVRATVAHDSCERIVAVECSPSEHQQLAASHEFKPIDEPIRNPKAIGVDIERVVEEAYSSDPGIQEFCRFYTERRTEEVRYAGGDERRRAKLYEDFTPRLEVSLVGLKGSVYRCVRAVLSHDIDGKGRYQTKADFVPSQGRLSDAPVFKRCGATGRAVPQNCLSRCELSGVNVLSHLLVKSELSERLALPELTVRCALSGKVVLKDEVAQSSVTGNKVITHLLKKSDLSGRLAEPEHIRECDFTATQVLADEIRVSQISGRKYRFDQEGKSDLSGLYGHISEFSRCAETNSVLAATELERCEETGKLVKKGLLLNCEESGKRVAPSEIEICSLTKRRVLKRYLVTSSISRARIIESEAVRSHLGNFCTPFETMKCVWSERSAHPEDLRECVLTGALVHIDYLTFKRPFNLAVLELIMLRRKEALQEQHRWPEIELIAGRATGERRCKIDAAVASPSGNLLAVALDVSKWFGMIRLRKGFLFSIANPSIVGRIADLQDVLSRDESP